MEDKEMYFKILTMLGDEITRCKRLHISRVTDGVKRYAVDRIAECRELSQWFRYYCPVEHK